MYYNNTIECRLFERQSTIQSIFDINKSGVLLYLCKDFFIEPEQNSYLWIVYGYYNVICYDEKNVLI